MMWVRREFVAALALHCIRGSGLLELCVVAAFLCAVPPVSWRAVGNLVAAMQVASAARAASRDWPDLV